jgi:hypothetical protein
MPNDTLTTWMISISERLSVVESHCKASGWFMKVLITTFAGSIVALVAAHLAVIWK